MSVAALVLSILGLVTCWLPVGPILALVALVLGIISMKSAKGNKGLGIVGIVVGAIALLVGVVVNLLIAFVFKTVVDEAPAVMDQLKGPETPAQQLPPESPFQKAQ